jgi:hypothetical protein
MESACKYGYEGADQDRTGVTFGTANGLLIGLFRVLAAVLHRARLYSFSAFESTSGKEPTNEGRA